MRHNRKQYYSILFFLLLILQVKAEVYPPISHLKIEQGLSNNSVRCIYQDKNGFMWFGTYDGLNCYDGTEFKVFRNKLNDPNSLPHNYIYTINEDNHGNVWVGTGQGIAIYNRLFSKFTPDYYRPYESKRTEKITCSVNIIEKDAKENIYIGTNGWGLFVHHGKDVAKQIPYITGEQVNANYTVQGIIKDGSQRIWLFIQNYGLCLYDDSKEKIIPINGSLKSANCMIVDGENNIWVGTSNGLYKYAISANAYTKHYGERIGELSSSNVASLAFNNNGNLWIGTDGGGVNILNVSTGSFDYILPAEGQDKLCSESIFSIYNDDESRVWLGTMKGGVNILDAKKNRFRTIARDPFSNNSLSINFIYSFFEDTNGKLWIGTDGGGITTWDRQSNIFKNYKHIIGLDGSLSNNSVANIKRDYARQLWVATFGGGLDKYDERTGIFKHYKCVDDKTGEENKFVWLIYEDRNKDLWVGTFYNGKLYKLNREQDKFETFDETLYDIISMEEDSRGILWAGNSHQLIKVDRKTRQHNYYEIGKPVRAIHEDKNGRLWLGTEGGGLVLFDKTKNTITARYADAEGLCNNSVLNILEDKRGRLWMSTFNGIARFDEQAKKFVNFYQSDGLQSNQFSYGAALQLQTGELVFGGINGFNIFNPDSIDEHRAMPNLLFTDIKVNNKTLSDSGHYKVETDANNITSLVVPYNEAILSFGFVALEYSSPQKIKYEYYLEGLDNGWNHAANLHNINYNNLREGNYVLHVKSTNAEGEWSKNELILSIKVLPPWYRSWLAYCCYLIMIGSLVAFYVRYKNRQSKLEYEIKVSHINAEKEKEINQKRLSFFTNVSHEFRTPLTLIINPIKDILQKTSTEESKFSYELNTAQQNAKRLLSLVDQLLLFRKAEEEVDKLNVGKVNFYDLCKDVYVCFLQMAKAKQIEYLFECNNTDLELYLDKEKMEIVFYNLLSNAFKFTPEKGKIIFSVAEKNNDVFVTVKDTGCGIDKDAGDKLFEKFYQVNNNAHGQTGFGIGLYLVKHFVENHNGKISYESEPGIGTSFSIALDKKLLVQNGVSHAYSGTSKVFEELIDAELPPQNDAHHFRNVAADETIVTSKPSVLIVEDEAQMRQYVSQLFGDKYTVYEAENAETGLSLTQQFLPDIIVSDIVMKGMSGIEFCKKVKENPALSHIPVILLTSSSAPETKLKGIEDGADDYILKPFEKEFLLARVNSLLKNRNSLRKYFYNEITLRPSSLKVSEEDKVFIEKCIAIVESNLLNDDFNTEKFAAAMNMSHSNLYKKIRSVSGQSIASFIRFVRLRKAADYLINTEKNINEVTIDVGFNDVKYFREQFFKLFAMNPSEYIKKYRVPFHNNMSVNGEVKK